MTRPTSALNQLIPVPVSARPLPGKFDLTPETVIQIASGGEDVKRIARYLADRLFPATGYKLKVKSAGQPAKGVIRLATTRADPTLGDEGYELTVTPEQINLTAPKPAGLFWGIQTLRQLLPSAIEAAAVQPGPWQIPACAIRDYPRFAWRGAMLDVARHFFSVEIVQQVIDRLACYKLNRLHLHLADDQGWRLMINSWPRLATYGGSTEVDGGKGGFYTQAEYTGLVQYAQSRFISIIPEIDMPGHTNAALASYAELNANGIAPALYTGTKVGFSTLSADKDLTYRFVDDVVREIASLTPSLYIHIGGDEAHVTQKDDYLHFIEKVQAIVQSHGKQMVGWDEIAQVKLLPTTIAQLWHNEATDQAVRQGAKVILSPASKTYVDMKYNESFPLGLSWAGLIEVPDAYNWDPASQYSGVSEDSILGVEAPLWSETIRSLHDIDILLFPRLIGIAEIAWSPAAKRDWDEYKVRLANQGHRLEAMGVNYYRSPLVPWS